MNDEDQAADTREIPAQRTRAKFTCHYKVPNSDGSTTIHLHAMYGGTGGSPENEAFFKATPNGQISLHCANEQAAAQFEQGKHYYVDFTPAE